MARARDGDSPRRVATSDVRTGAISSGEQERRPVEWSTGRIQFHGKQPEIALNRSVQSSAEVQPIDS